MKILVLGGMHGNEPLGLKVVKRLQDSPIPNVDALFANERAIKADKRFVAFDLNRSFPGDSASANYEWQRAAELLQKSKDYDIVLDFHNTHCPDNDCGFVGQTAGKSLYDLAGWLGLGRVIVADYDCINKYAPNCISIEISLSSELCRSDLWCDLIAGLARRELAELDTGTQIEKYQFVYRMTLDDRDRLDLQTKNMRAFQPLEESLASAMGITAIAYPIFIADAYTPYNFGGLLAKKDDV